MILNLLRKVNVKIFFLIIGMIVPFFILLPLTQIVYRFFESASLYYQTLIESNAIWRSIVRTLELILKVGFISASIGFSLAFLMTFYHIKFHKIINILLIIPLGIPVYVAAYTYTNIFHFIPFLKEILRSDFLMSGSVFIYSMFLYPYVYIASKSYLNKNMTEFIAASKTLGGHSIRTFFRIILPISRPVIMASVAFVIFETLSDFAVVEYYGVLTLSRYINLSWFANGDFVSAVKFSVYILFILFILLFTERVSRGRKRYSDSEVHHKPIKKKNANLMTSIGIYFFIGLTIVLSSLLPIGQMLISAYNNLNQVNDLGILGITFNSLIITFISILLILVFSLLLTTLTIYIKGYKKNILSSVLTLGYMIPSMVLALGIYMFYIRLDQWLYYALNDYGLNRMLFTSTLAVLIIGFFIKFFSIAYTNLLSAYQKISFNILEASETLGENKLVTMFRVSIPMLKNSIIAVSIIMFIDMIKELTIVYSLRPFNFKTLSTEVYRYAGNEMINVAAFPSLIIILLCTLLIIYLERGSKK